MAGRWRAMVGATLLVSSGLVGCVPTAPPQISISTAALPAGTAGASYRAAFEASGGSGSESWQVANLPAGLSVSPDGILSGIPVAMGTTQLALSVEDANGTKATKSLALAITSTMPPACFSAACAALVPDPGTVSIPASRVLGVTRDGGDVVTSVKISGTPPGVGSVVAFAAGGLLPSGMIATVSAKSANPDGSETLSVMRSDLGTAFSDMAINTGPHAAPVAAKTASLTASSFSCDGNVSIDVGSTTVTPTFTPGIAAISKRPVAGAGTVYLGPGGLQLFNFDLEASLTASLDFSISAAATCTVTLPAVTAVVPVGGPVAIIAKVVPKLTLEVSGAARVRTSATLRCGGYYQWQNGVESGTSYCKKVALTPLGLDSSTGVDATLKGVIDASVTINEITGITGNLTGALHAGWGPTRQPQGQVDVKVTGDLSACLACFWKSSPTRVTIISGTLYNRVLATYNTQPPSATTTTSTPPTTIPSGGGMLLTGASSVSTGHDVSCASLVSGGVKCWGSNAFGALGNGGDPHGSAHVPVDVLGIDDATTVEVGTAHACAILSGGAVKCWGDNDYGQLGNGSFTGSSVPVSVTGITGATSLSLGSLHTCAVISGGVVKCWGSNHYGELGDNTLVNSASPVTVTGIAGAAKVTAGDSRSCALLSNTTIKCWGSNAHGELGDGTTFDSRSAVTVSGVSGAVEVSTSEDHTCALLNTGSVRCWGYNNVGQLGSGSTGGGLTPVAALGITNAVHVNAGDGHTCAAISGGSVKCWGYNRYGDLGNDSTTDSASPVAVSGLQNAVDVDAGRQRSCALLASTGVKCWGYNWDGQLGDGSKADSWVPVDVLSGSSGTDLAPTAVGTYVLSTISEPGGRTVRFDASDSSDPDGSIQHYRWSFGDGVVWEGGPGETLVQHTYTGAGPYVATLTVADAQGLAGRTTVNVLLS